MRNRDRPLATLSEQPVRRTHFLGFRVVGSRVEFEGADGDEVGVGDVAEGVWVEDLKKGGQLLRIGGGNALSSNSCRGTLLAEESRNVIDGNGGLGTS
jgi:hypothetical protein